MHLTGLQRLYRSGSAGFSLLEVVIAAGLLLLTVTAVTLSVTTASRGAARLEGAMDADRAVRTTAERLRALPFCASAYPVLGTAAPSARRARDLVAAVFPHARTASNTPTAWFVGADEDDVAAGSFVTVLDVGGVSVRCVAKFLAAGNGLPLDAAALAGWAQWEATEPPASALEVRMRAVSSGSARLVVIVRSALGAPVIDPRSSPAA
jgi:hypothetical protein